MQGVDHPGLSPDDRRDVRQQPGLRQRGFELGPEDHRQGAHRHQKRRVLGSAPVLAIDRKTAGADQQMHMWMVEHGAGPSVQHRQNSGRSSQPAGIPRERLHRRSGTTEQGAINYFLLRPSERAELGGQRERQEVVRTWQQPGSLLFEPGVRLLRVALGAMPVAAGVISIAKPSAVITLRHVPAEEGGAAMLNIPQGSLLAGPQRVPDTISRRALADNVRDLQHEVGIRGRSATLLAEHPRLPGPFRSGEYKARSSWANDVPDWLG